MDMLKEPVYSPTQGMQPPNSTFAVHKQVRLVSGIVAENAGM